MEATNVPHTYGDAPEQVALDLLLATYRSFSGISSRNDNDTEVLAEAQEHLNEAYKLLRLIHPEVCV